MFSSYTQCMLCFETMMTETFNNKLDELKSKFECSNSPQEIAMKVMSYGKGPTTLDPKDCTAENKVQGCQSNTYVTARLIEGKIQFDCDSDALISKGIASLLAYVYSSEPPEVVIHNPPHFAKDLGILKGLSINRANGLMSMYMRMKLLAIQSLMAQSS